MPRDFGQQPVAITTQLGTQVAIRSRHRDVDQLNAQGSTSGDIGGVHTAPDHQPRRQTKRCQRPNALALDRSHGGNADLHLGNAQRIEPSGDFELFAQGESDTGRLLTVPQGSVVDDDRRQ